MGKGQGNQTNQKAQKAQRKGFHMPHLLWIMLGLLLAASLLTYIIPAGEFAVDAGGKILGDQFHYLGHQTPVSPWRMLMLLLDGLSDSGVIIWVVLVSGAMTGVVLATGAIDDFLNWAVYKLKDKDESILISIMFLLMVYLGGFGGTDALIAVVPIGMVFAKKLRLDPICAIGVSTYATLLGFGTGPVKQATTQMLMGVPVYGAFFTMFLSMNFFMVIGLYLLLRYIKRLRKNPAISPMYSEGWRPGQIEGNINDSIKEVRLSARTALILLLFLGQYGLIVAYPFIGGDSDGLYPFMLAVNLVTAVICGLIGKFTFDKVGDEFVKGLAGLAFVGFVIGLAKVMSLVLGEGRVIHTIVYFMTRPLMNLPRSFASVGMTAVISIVNLVIPSATSKAAILVPIIKPISEALKMNPALAVQAFQYGDGFTNMFSPFLGWTVGSCVMAGVPFPKWFRWIFPKVLIFIAVSFAVMILLTECGWTAF